MIQSAAATTPKLCIYYRQGHCGRGVHCKFSHEGASRRTPQPSAQTVRADEKPSAVTICEFYKQGFCRFGDNCLFSHSPFPPDTSISRMRTQLGFGPPSVHGPPSSPLPSSASFGSCKFYARGICSKGEVCPFPHPDAIVGKTTPLPPPASLSPNGLKSPGRRTFVPSTHA